MSKLNSLYRTIYQTDAKPFDPGNRIYTVLMKGAAPYDGFYDSLEQNLKLRMNDDAISFMELPSSADRNLSQEMSDLRYDLNFKYFQCRKNFVLLDFIKDGTAEEFERALSFKRVVTEEKLLPGESMSIVYILQAGKNVQDVALNIPSELFDGVNFYCYTIPAGANELRRQVLFNSVLVPVILSSFPDKLREHEFNSARAVTLADQFRNGLVADSHNMFAPTENRIWSSYYCEFLDPKMDFLSWYAYNLCDKLKMLSKDIIKTQFEAFYKEHVARDIGSGSSERVRKAALLHAVQMIPQIEPPAKRKKNDDGINSLLNEHFERLYGPKGVQIVDLSLKMTYASMENDAHLPPAQFCVQMICDNCKSYYTDDLQKAVKTALEEYTDELKAMLSTYKADWQNKLKKEYVSEADLFTQGVPSYINKYIDFNQKQMELSFWEKVLEYVANAREDFMKYGQEKADIISEIKAFKAFCKENMKQLSVPQVAFAEYTLDDVRAFINGEPAAEKLYRELREEFENSSTPIGETVVYNRIDDVMAIPMINNIYHDVEISFVHDTYSIRGYERNGKYMIFSH